MTTILVVDDDPVSCELMADVLKEGGTDVVTETNPERALELASERQFDVALFDIRMPAMDGITLLQRFHESQPDIPIIIMTGFGSVESAVEALGAGAADYLSKPADVEEIRAAVTRALGRRNEETAELPTSVEGPGQLVGRSPAMVRIYGTIARAAAARSTVLILGESGTGKELIARSIHDNGPRARGPYMAVDCGALTESLLEAELFGHVRGSFTGAVRDAPGLFRMAQGGTIFLDEIGDISPTVQARLLRALQEHEIRPVGGTQWAKIDARVIAATNRDLAQEVSEGRFREDLYYRLRVITVDVPPLRDRLDDLPLLIDHLVRRAARDAGRPAPAISESALRALSGHDWPGNVRELAHVIERAVVVAPYDVIGRDDLPPPFGKSSTRAAPAIPDDRPTLEQLKQRYIETVLGEQKGNVTRAAAILGVDRRSLYRMLERYGIPTRGPTPE